MLLPAGVGFNHPGYIKPRVLVLSSALGLFASFVILAIICANLANLQLARAAARSRETAIRLALGCSRARLTRQLLVESTVLALPGCAIALALLQANRATERYLVPKLQFEVGLAAGTDARVLLLTAVVAVLAVGLFGLVPALRASRANVVPPPASAGAASWSGGRPTRLRRSLVVTQLALSVVLLVGGMLFVRSLVAARAMDLGFDARERALVSFNVGLQGYDERRGQTFYDRGARAGPGAPRHRRRRVGPSGAVRYLRPKHRLVRRRHRQLPGRHPEDQYQRHVRRVRRGARAPAGGRSRLHAGGFRERAARHDRGPVGRHEALAGQESPGAAGEVWGSGGTAGHRRGRGGRRQVRRDR